MMNTLGGSILVFLAGTVAGAAVLFLLLPARRQYGRLMRERDESRRALRDYRTRVDHHFHHTAELVNRMTDSYRAVHEHLSEGARELCSENGRRLAGTDNLDALPDDSPMPERVRPPLDYAPQAKGTLSEGYGLDRDKQTPFEPVEGVDDLDRENTEVEPPRDYAAAQREDDAELDEDAGRDRSQRAE